MKEKDRSLLGIVARTGLLAFIAVFVVMLQHVSSAVTLTEADLPRAVEYYVFARRLLFASLGISGINIIYMFRRIAVK